MVANAASRLVIGGDVGFGGALSGTVVVAGARLGHVEWGSAAVRRCMAASRCPVCGRSCHHAAYAGMYRPERLRYSRCSAMSPAGRARPPPGGPTAGYGCQRTRACRPRSQRADRGVVPGNHRLRPDGSRTAFASPAEHNLAHVPIGVVVSVRESAPRGQLNESDQLGVVDQRDVRQPADLIPRLGQDLIGVHGVSGSASR